MGLSLYATSIDTSDLIADAGGTYVLDLSYFVANWVGVAIGWVLAAHFVVMPMYRAGMYTKAEYLEARFGPPARLLSAFVQVQYRTMVLGIIATTLYLVLAIVCDWGQRLVGRDSDRGLGHDLHGAWWTAVRSVYRCSADGRHADCVARSVLVVLEQHRRLERA